MVPNIHRAGTILLILVAFLMLWFVESARADVITLPLVVAATGMDDGPQDGVFDALTPFNLGSVNNNGFTSYRTAVEFSLASLPAGATINSATLSWAINNWDGTRRLEVHGYPGDGIMQLADFAHNGSVGNLTIGPMSLEFSYNDVTSFVSQLRNADDQFAGFNFREMPANTGNFTVMDLPLTGDTAPSLRVDYTLIPEPSCAALAALGLMLLLRVSPRPACRRSPDNQKETPP